MEALEDPLEHVPDPLALANLEPSSATNSLGVAVLIPGQNALVGDDTVPFGKQEVVVEHCAAIVPISFDQLGDRLVVGRVHAEARLAGKT